MWMQNDHARRARCVARYAIRRRAERGVSHHDRPLLLVAPLVEVNQDQVLEEIPVYGLLCVFCHFVHLHWFQQNWGRNDNQSARGDRVMTAAGKHTH